MRAWWWAVLALGCASPMAWPALPELEARHQAREPLTPAADGVLRSVGFSRLSSEPTRVLTATLPRSLLEPIRVSDSSGPFALAVFLEPTHDVPGRLVDDEVRWAGAFPDTEVRAFADQTSLEVDYLLRSPSAPRRFHWRLERPPGSTWSVGTGGRFELVVQGEPALAIPRPLAVDSTGRELAVRVEQVDDGFVFTLAQEPAAWPALLDPVVEVPLWSKRFEATPSARQNHALVFDSARGRTVLFGGTGTQLLRDTWEFDGSRWREVFPATVPPARASAASVFDERRGLALVLGGTGGVRLADGWGFDGTDWVQVPMPGTFSVSFAPRAVWDRARGRVLLTTAVGSLGGTECFASDGGSWVQLPAVPVSLDAPGLAYDEVRDRVVLFGGTDFLTRESAEFFEFDGTAWARATAPTLPSARQGHRLLYDPTVRRVSVLMGGTGSIAVPDSWTWDGLAFAPLVLPFPSRLNFAAAPIAGGALLVLGGFVQDDVWLGSADGGWRELDAGRALALRAPALAWDPALGVTVLTGGERDGVPQPGTWAWDGGSWARLSATSPTARSRHAMTWDERRRQLVLYGSVVDAQLLGFDGVTWSPLGPGPKLNVHDTSLAFDPLEGRLLQFGGRDFGGNSTAVLHLETDGGWVQAPATGGPTLVLARPGVALDRSTNELVVLGELRPPDLEFVWDGGWSQRPVPFPLGDGDLVWDTDRRLVVGVESGTTRLWERRSGVWSQSTPPTRPPPESSPRIAYDSARHRLVLHLASGATWEYSALRSTGSDCSTSQQCLSGLCVDGVCCGSRCGDGVTTDCQACSVAAGSAMDGVCGARLGAPVCFTPPAGSCLLPVTCTAMSAQCGVPRPDPTCDAGAPDAGAVDAGTGPVTDAGTTPTFDAGLGDGGLVDDAGALDAGSADAGAADDAGAVDAGARDASVVVDAGPPDADAGVDAGVDGGVTSPGIFAVGCGCSQSEGVASVAAAALLSVLRRRSR